MKKPPKRQHYVPQFHLRQFLDPKLLAEGQEMLWVYEAGKEPRKSRPESTAFENYFYSVEKDGERLHVVEEVLSKLESMAAPTLKKLAERDFHLSDRERGELAAFVALSFTRTPFFREQTNSVLEMLMKRITETAAAAPGYFEEMLPRIGVTENVSVEAQKMRQFIQRGFEVKQTSKAYSIRMFFELMISLIPVIENMDWAFCVTEDKTMFLTTDTTISLYDPEARPPFGVGFASSPRSEFRFPLSKEICLVGNWQNVKGVIRARPFFVRNVNKFSMLFAQRYLYASDYSTKIKELFNRVCKLRELQRHNGP
jgi:hypothetical protein